MLCTSQLKEACSCLIPAHLTHIFPSWACWSFFCLEAWHSLGDRTWYLIVLLFLLFFSRSTFLMWLLGDVCHSTSWFCHWEKLTHFLSTLLQVPEVFLLLLCLGLAVPTSSLQLCQPYPGLRRVTMIKVAHYKKHRFPRTLDEIKFSINLQSIFIKSCFLFSA